MSFKFEKLEIWTESLDYADAAYDIAEALPRDERYNLTDQLKRASTSITLNIAEGSTGQSDKEQSRFLSMALRSLLETVACQHLINRRGYCSSDKQKQKLNKLYKDANNLAARIQAMRNRLANRAGEPEVNYLAE